MQEDEKVFGIVLVILFLIIALGGGIWYLRGKGSDMNSDTQARTLERGDEGVVLTDRTVIMETNYGTLHIEMLDEVAPRTTENFIRLTARKYFDNLKFHRIVQAPGFAIIQGGDPKGNGTGGQSFWGSEFEDEIAKIDNPNEFRAPELYFNDDQTEIIYRKGYVAMANRGPNTNGSQFFIMLDDTQLSPDYTIFGKIDINDFAILDKINAEVKPSSGRMDGAPDKELKIISARLNED